MHSSIQRAFGWWRHTVITLLHISQNLFPYPHLASSCWPTVSVLDLRLSFIFLHLFQVFIAKSLFLALPSVLPPFFLRYLPVSPFKDYSQWEWLPVYISWNQESHSCQKDTQKLVCVVWSHVCAVGPLLGGIVVDHMEILEAAMLLVKHHTALLPICVEYVCGKMEVIL